MSSEAYEEFKTKIGPFLDLWQSGEVTCVATADSESGEYVSMATRFVFKPEPPATGSPPFVLQNERTRFLAVKVDYPRQTINQLVYQLHANGRLELEIGQYIHIVYLSRAHVRLAAAAGPPRFDWYPVSNIPRAEAQQAYGIPRRC